MSKAGFSGIPCTWHSSECMLTISGMLGTSAGHQGGTGGFPNGSLDAGASPSCLLRLRELVGSSLNLWNILQKRNLQLFSEP